MGPILGTTIVRRCWEPEQHDGISGKRGSESHRDLMFQGSGRPSNGTTVSAPDCLLMGHNDLGDRLDPDQVIPDNLDSRNILYQDLQSGTLALIGDLAGKIDDTVL